MSAYQKNKHDIGITNVLVDGSGTSETGIILVRENNAPVFAEFDGNYLADQVVTNTPSQEYTNPEREIILYQDNFSKGFGQYIQSDNNKYHKSFGMDLSVNGQAMAGWNSTAVTKPVATAPVLTDGGMEIWTDATTLTNWTKSGAILNRTGTPYAGTYCAGMSAQNANIYQDISWLASYQGRKFTFTCYVKADVADRAYIQINDGVGTTTSSAHGGTGNYAQLSVTRTLNTAATRLRLICIILNGAADGWFDEAAITGTTPTAIASHATFNSAEYIGAGSVLAKLNAGGTEFVAQYEFSAAITDLVPFQVSGTDYLIILLGTSTAYYYMETDGTLTQSNATDKTYQFGAWVHTTVDTMYANDSDNTIRSTIDPLNGGTAWSVQTVIGLASEAITGLKAKSGALHIAKEDMPYYLDSSGNVQNDLAPELKSAQSSTSGKNSHIWQGNWYYPAGDQALVEIGTGNNFIQPSKYGIDISEFAGQIMAIASDEEWLYIAVDNSTKIEILKGRWVGSDWVWHPIHELTLTGCETMWVSTVYQKRLWISSTTATESLYYLPLPTKYGDITSDANASFKTGTYFETSYLHGNFPSDIKSFIKMTLELGHVYDANIYFNGYYKKIGDSSWTSIGAFKGSSSSRIHSIYLDVDASSYYPISTKMKFKIEAITDDTAKTPLLLNYKVSAVLYPVIRRIIYCKVLCAEEVECRNGLKEKNMDTIIATLDNLRSASYPVTMHDIHGTARTVKYLPLPSSMPKYQIIRDEKGFEKARHYNLMLMEITVSGTAGSYASVDASGNKIPRAATFVVAASDASALQRAQADYVCDGTADDVQIQAAIDAATHTYGYGSVCLSSGRFYINTAIVGYEGLNLFGQGFSTYLTAVNTSQDIITIGDASDNTQGVRLANFSMSGQSGDGHGIVLTRVHRSVFENIWGRGFGATAYGFYLDGCLLNTFTNCQMSTNLPDEINGSGNGFYLVRHAGSGISCNGNTFVGCIAEGGVNGFYQADQSGEGGNTIIGGVFEGNSGYELYVKNSAAFNTVGLWIEGTSDPAILIDSCTESSFNFARGSKLQLSTCVGVKVSGHIGRPTIDSDCVACSIEGSGIGSSIVIDKSLSTDVRKLRYSTSTDFMYGRITDALVPIMTNGSLENWTTGVPDDFTSHGSPTLTQCGVGQGDTEVDHLDSCAKIEWASATYHGIRYTIPAAHKGTWVVVRGRVKTVSGTPAINKWYDAGTSAGSLPLIANANWCSFECSIYLDPTYDTHELIFGSNTASSAGEIYFDRLSIWATVPAL